MDHNLEKCQYHFGLITEITAQLSICTATWRRCQILDPLHVCFTWRPEHHQQLCGSGPGRHFTFDPSLGFNSVTSDLQLRLVLHLNHSVCEEPPWKLIYSPQLSWLKMMAPPFFCSFTVWGSALVINHLEHWPTAAKTFPGGHIYNWLIATQRSIRIKTQRWNTFCVAPFKASYRHCKQLSFAPGDVQNTASPAPELRTLTSPTQWHWK